MRENKWQMWSPQLSNLVRRTFYEWMPLLSTNWPVLSTHHRRARLISRAVQKELDVKISRNAIAGAGVLVLLGGMISYAWFSQQASIYRADPSHGCALVKGEWLSVLPNSNPWFCPYFESRLPTASLEPRKPQPPAPAESAAFDSMLKNLETNRR